MAGKNREGMGTRLPPLVMYFNTHACRSGRWLVFYLNGIMSTRADISSCDYKHVCMHPTHSTAWIRAAT